MSAARKKIAGTKVNIFDEPDIKLVIDRMKDEVAHPNYIVGDYGMIDWCPCCGLNFRIYKDGKIAAKLIMDFKTGVLFAKALKAMAIEMRLNMPNEMTKTQLMDRIQESAIKAAIQSPHVGDIRQEPRS